MKNFFTLLAALFFCAMMSNAQTSFVATLQHEGEFIHYYGPSALQSAYNSAVTGDIITLSPGTFTAPSEIRKGITLRGTGMEAAETTNVSGQVSVFSEDSTYVTTFEGIVFNDDTYVRHYLNNKRKGTIKFIKCNFSKIRTDYYSDNSNATTGPAVRLYNCVVNSVYFASYTHPDFMFYNCYVVDPSSSGSNFYDTTTAFVNCVIEWRSYYGSNSYYNGYYSSCYYLNFYNCIFNRNPSSSGYPNIGSLPSTATAYNCLSINYDNLFNNLVSGGNNKTVDSVSDVFTTYQGDRNVGETFELTETAKEKYIGTDGTQIGMQGGYYPYNTTVQYPVITKFDVDAQTNKAGILNIDVEVDGK